MRRGELSEEDAQGVQELFRRHCDQGLYHVVPIQEGDYRRARQWMAQRSTSLRTLDALHLAVADRRDVQVLTADTIMSQAGTHHGVSVELLQAE